MKNRLLSYYRHHRFRVINRKLAITEGILDNDYWSKRPGLLAKGKIHCTCWMCKRERFKDSPKRQDQAKLDAMALEIQDYFNGNK